MKFFRLDLLTLLISLFILGSCKNDNTIGLPVSDQQVNGTLAVYDDITVNTVAEEPVALNYTPGGTTSSPKFPLGEFNDNIMGLTSSRIAAGLSLPGSSAYALPAGTITTDSAVLELRYADGFYGDSLSSKYKINVYRLNEKPSPSETYNTDKAWTYDNGALVSNMTAPFNARPNTRVKITNIVTGAADTLFAAPAHIRVPIKTSFINTYFFGATSSQLASNTLFQNNIRGIYIALQRNQVSDAGGTMMFNLDSSRINVYYRVVNAGVTDTAMVTLPLSTSAAEIRHTYSTAVNNALANTQSNSVFYLQGGSLRAKIAFPTLSSLFGTTDINQVAINRAELVITPAPNTGVPYAPAPQLTLYRYDISKQRQYLPDANGSPTSGALDPYYLSTAVFGGRYNDTQKQYSFLVTGYIQNLLKNKLTDYGTYIAPIDSFNTAASAIPISPTAGTASRTVAVGSDKTSPYKIKLNVIYTKTK